MINTRELVGAALCASLVGFFPRGRKSQKAPVLLESEDIAVKAHKAYTKKTSLFCFTSCLVHRCR